jgi:uncharacterized membrane protein YtjA (UPF0391 family)
MSKWAKIFLVLSIVTLVFGLTSVGSSIAYGALKPAGVIFFMLFYIVHLFHKEVMRYDEERRSKMAQVKGNSKAATASKSAEALPSTMHKNPALMSASPRA